MPSIRNLQICLSDFRPIDLAVACFENRNISWSYDTSSESIWAVLKRIRVVEVTAQIVRVFLISPLCWL
jgi:hypothetical protein